MGLVSLRLVRAAGFQVEKKRWISKIIQAPGLDVRISNIIVFAPALDECGYIRGNVFLLQLFFLPPQFFNTSHLVMVGRKYQSKESWSTPTRLFIAGVLVMWAVCGNPKCFLPRGLIWVTGAESFSICFVFK